MPRSREITDEVRTKAGADNVAMMEVIDWFVREAQESADQIAAKAVQRGAYDLYLLGRTMAGLLDRAPENPDDTYYLQLGILFYAEGKIARALSALKEGRLPNPDDWHDLSVYGRMAKYVQEHGQWP